MIIIVQSYAPMPFFTSYISSLSSHIEYKSDQYCTQGSEAVVISEDLADE